MVPLYPSGTRKLVKLEEVTGESGEMEEMIGGSVEVIYYNRINMTIHRYDPSHKHVLYMGLKGVVS